MKLTVLGSGSKGNCYLLHNDNEALIIEAGVKLIEVKKALDFNVTKIVGCIITHEHMDHAGYMNHYLNASIPVWASIGTIHAMDDKLTSKRLPFILESGSVVRLGNFSILPFDVVHDAAEPVGFLINHPETGNVLFITDSYYSKNTFRNLNNIIIEANYDQKIVDYNIENGYLNPVVLKRLLKSHMSIETCLELLSINDLSKVNNIVLCHLSDGNSNANDFKKMVQNSTGKNTFIADTGLDIDFNKSPF